MGVIQIKKTKNNLFIILKNIDGKMLTVFSFGVLGFKAADKITYYAHYKLAEEVGIKALEFGLKELAIEFLGTSLHMKAILSPLEKLNFEIQSIVVKDLTNHGGCRFKKKRRK